VHLHASNHVTNKKVFWKSVFLTSRRKTEGGEKKGEGSTMAIVGRALRSFTALGGYVRVLINLEKKWGGGAVRGLSIRKLIQECNKGVPRPGWSQG